MSEITHDQARALAALVATLRPAWDIAGIRKALWAARHKGTAAQLAHAAIEAATTPECRTPAIIAHDGPHWTLARPLTETAANFDRCPHPGHQSYPAWHCAACRADDLAADETREEVGTGASEAADPASTEATARVTRSADYPKAPAQAHLLPGPALVRAAMRQAGIPTTDELRNRQETTP